MALETLVAADLDVHPMQVAVMNNVQELPEILVNNGKLMQIHLALPPVTHLALPPVIHLAITPVTPPTQAIVTIMIKTIKTGVSYAVRKGIMSRIAED